ncbi:hypothetical protein SPLA10_PHROGS00072 [Salmonella phage SPLA10]|nr:hypothetical protein SPLA10_PHROGS00072 [Salmonella phage SPLA10]
MINRVLESISKRVMNDKGRRVLLIMSLYALITKAQGKELHLAQLNEELNLVVEHDGCDFPSMSCIYDVIWGCRFKEFAAKAPAEKIMRYVTVRLPKWLDYRGSKEYSFDSDIATLTRLLAK